MSKLHPTTYFISLLLFILVLRQAHLSPLTLILSPISRLTQEQKLSERFCTNPQPTFSSDEESRAESYRSSLSSLRDDNTLTSFIERGEPKDTFAENYGKSFIPYIVPWVVFFGLGILSCLIYLINWCCMNCSCLKNRACGCCKAPKRPRFKNCYVILSVLFMVFTIGAGVTGIVFVSGIPKYSDATMCSVVKFIEQVQDGSEDDKWIGIGPAINKIDDLVSKVNDAVSGLSVYDSLLADFNQNLDDVSNSVDSLYTDNQGSTLDRINPDEGIYTPYYIQELGPSTTDGTITNLIQNELDKSRQSLNDNQATLDSFKNDVKSSTDQVLNDVLANRPTLVQTNTWLTNALDDISNNQSTIDQVIGIISGLLLGLVIANVSVGGIAIISILLVCCGAKLFNKSIHLSWCILGLLMIIGWAISTVLFAGTIIVSEACDVGTGALQNPEFFNKTFDKLGTTFNWKSNDFNRTRNIIYRCVHGDGDLAQEFNLTSNLVFFNDIFTNINQISSDATESLNALPESLSSSQDTVLSQFKEGLIPDSNETIIDLIALNMLTNSSENPCTTIDDRWYLNSQNCTVNEGNIFQATSSADFNVPDATCIGYNNWNASQRSIGDRYTQSQFSGLECGSSNNDAFVISYINSLARNRQQSNTLIDTLQTSVNNLEDKYTNFKVSLQRTPQTLEDTNTTVADIYNTLTDKDTGLIANTNCKFIAEAIGELRDVTCTGLGATVYQTTIAFLVLSFVTLFGTMFLFCLAKRFTVQNENGKLSPESYVVK